MNKVIYVEIEIELQSEIEIEVEFENEVEIEVEDGGHGERLPYYTGEYVILPGLDDKTLETKNKSMSDDVTVLKIPKYEFDNNSNGQTIVIGGNY